MYSPPYTKRSMSVIQDMVNEMTEARELALKERNFNFSVRAEDDRFKANHHAEVQRLMNLLWVAVWVICLLRLVLILRW